MIPLIKSTFYKETLTKKALNKFIIKSTQLSFGAECQLFEKEFSAWQGARQSILLNSGSSANLAIVQALLNLGRIKPGDNVGFSAVTWSTNVMPLIQLGLKPIPIDVSLKTLNVSPETLLEVIKKTNLKMIFITNLLGFCDELNEILDICKHKKIILIEDNCESLGSVFQGTKLGNFGLAGTFSFYVGHHMSTIEGGAVVTNDDELATMLRLVRAHGWDRNLDFADQEAMRKRFNVNSTFYSRYTFYDLGYNLRPTEITGFLGRFQLNFLNTIISKREKNFKYIFNFLKNNDNYYVGDWKHMEIISNFAYPLICKSSKIRDNLVKKCANKIEIRPVVGGDMSVQPFFSKYGGKHYNCPNARLIHEQGLYFGNNPELSSVDLKYICETFE